MRLFFISMAELNIGLKLSIIVGLLCDKVTRNLITANRFRCRDYEVYSNSSYNKRNTIFLIVIIDVAGL